MTKNMHREVKKHKTNVKKRSHEIFTIKLKEKKEKRKEEKKKK
jgi:hypothetical protein